VDIQGVVEQDVEIQRCMSSLGRYSVPPSALVMPFGDQKYALQQRVGIVIAAQLNAEFSQLVQTRGDLNLIQLLHGCLF
jgi:hypothetical protein